MNGEVAGLVLAGGRSSRMGRDKALLPPPGGDGGPTMLARAYGLLSAVTPRVWVSCVPERPYAGYPCLFDGDGERGAGAGILAGLRAAEAERFTALLVLPCDLPFMDAPTLRRLLAAHGDAPGDALAVVYLSAESGFLEPLVAVYKTAAAPFFVKAAAAGKRSLFDVIPPNRRLCLPYGANEARPFFNLNSPDDLQNLPRRTPGAQAMPATSALKGD